jgi:autotransporter-associated beta strand protein
MNTTNNKGPQPWIDPALEARVVAGVLGETSAFEASELDRVLAENPELAIFKRRIEAVHALVGFASRRERPKIQISPTRRQQLLEKLGARPVQPTKKALPFRRWLSPHMLNRLVACLVIMAFVAVLFSLSIPAVTGGIQKKASRRSISATSGVADPGSRDDPGGIVSGDPVSSTSSAVEHRVDYNGQAAMDGVLKSDAPAAGKPMEFAMNAAAEKQGPSIQQGRNSQQSREYAELRSAGNQPQPMVKDQLAATQDPQPLKKEVVAFNTIVGGMANQPQEAASQDVSGKAKAPLPAGTEEVRDSNGKFDGCVQYGAPIVPPADAAMALGVVGQPVVVAAPSAPKSSTVSPAPQAGDQLSASQASSIKAFTGGWGKGSGSGTGARSEFAKNKEQNQQESLRENVAAEMPAGQNGASLATASDSLYMFRGVNVLSTGFDGTASNPSSGSDIGGLSAAPVPMAAAKAKPSDMAEKQLAMDESKGVDLASKLEVTTSSGERARVGIVSGDADSARNKEAKPIGQALAGANTYTGATTVSGGTLGLDNVADREIAKEPSDKKSDAPPVLGDVPLAGRLFRPDSVKDRSLSFQAEIQTAKQPFSTFSLHVSDVSFQLAKDALARGAMPDPDRIRPEEFYNAFDYGDPSPAPGEEVACRIEQCAHPFLQQRDLVRIAVKVAAAGRAAGQPLRLTILLDTSGSMEREDRAASVRRALGTLATLLGPNDRVTLIGFARTPRLLAEQVPGDQAKKLVEIAARTPSEGGTNLEQALALASELALKQKLPAAQNRIVLLTDGAANLGNADPARLARQIEKTRQQGISFDACGVGANGLNDEMLEALTRKGDGRYYFLNTPEDADAGFARQLAGALRPAAENVKVQVVFNPARVSQYRLIGFEKHLLKKEDFRNDKVQAAELSAEEAGVAVYQVQTLPEGDGELGEVFVRFRDPANGRMVEHSWTMPYDAKAPSFDKAAPSMQLAATSALLAEKLRGDSRVDLNALSPVITNLRGQYPHQAKVADLIQMFEQMRR